MVRAGLTYDFTTAQQLNNPLLEAYGLLFAENNPAGVKAFLTELGLIQNTLRLPLVPLSEGLQQKVKSYLEKIIRIKEQESRTRIKIKLVSGRG